MMPSPNIIAIDVAGAILAVVEFLNELLSSSTSTQGGSSRDEKHSEVIYDKLKTLTSNLSTVYGHAARESPIAASQSSDDVVSLQKLGLSCVEDFGTLLEDLNPILRGSIESRSLHHLPKNEAEIESVIKSRFSEEKLEHLAKSVTIHVDSLIK
jgi:hypothetical protein